jgi:hypothetical protein
MMEFRKRLGRYLARSVQQLDMSAPGKIGARAQPSASWNGFDRFLQEYQIRNTLLRRIAAERSSQP